MKSAQEPRHSPMLFRPGRGAKNKERRATHGRLGSAASRSSGFWTVWRRTNWRCAADLFRAGHFRGTFDDGEREGGSKQCHGERIGFSVLHRAQKRRSELDNPVPERTSVLGGPGGAPTVAGGAKNGGKENGGGGVAAGLLGGGKGKRQSKLCVILWFEGETPFLSVIVFMKSCEFVCVILKHLFLVRDDCITGNFWNKVCFCFLGSEVEFLHSIDKRV